MAALNCDGLNSWKSLGQSPDPKNIAGASLFVVSLATWAEQRRSRPTPAGMPFALMPLEHSPSCRFLGKRKFSLPFGSSLKRKWNRKELQVPLQREVHRPQAQNQPTERSLTTGSTSLGTQASVLGGCPTGRIHYQNSKPMGAVCVGRDTGMVKNKEER